MASGFGAASSIAVASVPRGARRLGARAARGIELWLEAERDQLPLWLPVGLAAGISAWFALPERPLWIAFLLGAAGIALGALPLAGHARAGRALLWFAGVAALGCAIVWARAEHVAAPRLDRPRMAAFEARVTRVERLAARDAVRVRLAPDAGSGLPPAVRVNFATDYLPAGVTPGARIALRARLMPPNEPAVPGAYDFARVAWFDQLGATGRAFPGATLIAAAPPSGWREWLAALRSRLSAHILAQLPPGEGGVATSFVTGDQGALPQTDADAMRRSGLAHLLSVSGLHVTAVIAATMLLTIRLLALSRRAALRLPLPLIAAGVGALAGIGYTLLAGAEVPTLRSCIASLLVLGGIALGREAVTLRLVGAGALILLLLWPEALAGPSFQLSFAAVTAIVALHEQPTVRGWFQAREESWWRRGGRHLVALLLTGLAVEVALLPIGLFHFHRAGLYGSIANLVAIPLTTFVIMPLEALALLLDAVGWGAPAWWAAGEALHLLLAIAHAVADAPGSSAALPAMPRGAFGLMIAGGLWLCLWRTRVRRLGLIPIAIGAAWALMTPAPDILVTGDGRHLAVRLPDGRLGLLRERAGDYVRGMLGENAGVQGDASPLDALPGTRCSPDLCLVSIEQGGRMWRLLATRSVYPIDRGEMAAACATADIAVSERRLPGWCRPRWLKADATLLARTGGLAISLRGPTVRTVAEAEGRHPWVAERGGFVTRSLPRRRRSPYRHPREGGDPAAFRTEEAGSPPTRG